MTDLSQHQSERFVAAKELTRRLLEALGIRRVINVDDDHYEEVEQSVEEVIAALRAGTIEGVLVARTIVEDDEPPYSTDPDTEAIIDVLRDRWDDLDDDRRDELTLAASRGQSANQGTVANQSAAVAGNNAALLTLPELLGDSVDFIRLSLKQWRTEGEARLSDQVPTLLLFDRSFEREGMPSDAGDQLVKDILQRNDVPHVRVGLLTHTAEDLGRESEIALQIANDLGEQARSVIVVSKSRLKVETNFPEALRMVLFADELESFRAHAISSLRTANHEATQLLEKAERYALMATFESAKREGSYETDNALRMATTPARRALARELRDESFIVNTLSRLRGAATVDLYLDGGPKPANMSSIVWHERFDDREYLASLSLPIEVGDIFRVFDLLKSGQSAGSDRYYILLAQSCDLSVRENGKRSNDLQTVVITLLKPATGEDSGTVRPPKENQYDIGAFCQDSARPWLVNFAHHIHVPAIAVDACVLTPNGQSILCPEHIVPKTLPLSWERRASYMREEAEKMIVRMERFSAAVRPVDGKDADARDALKHLEASIAGAGVQHRSGITARIDTGTRTIEYGIQRIARIVDSTARGLLTLSAYHHSRPAFDGSLFYDGDSS